MIDFLEEAHPLRSTGSERTLIARLCDLMTASDPALSRLRLASRCILSMLLNGGVLVILTKLVHELPLTAYGLAIIVSYMGSISVRDKTPRAQLATRLLAGSAGIVAVLLASILSPIPTLADIAFLAVIFSAACLRIYGTRGTAIGIIAFMAYYMGDYMQAKPEQIGWVLLTTAIALGITQIVASFIVVDDPERDFRRALKTLDKRTDLILQQLQKAAFRGDAKNLNQKELDRHIAGLRGIVLMAEGFIPQSPGRAFASRGPSATLAVTLADLHLSIEHLAVVSLYALPPEQLIDSVRHSEEDLAGKFDSSLSAASPQDHVLLAVQALRRVHEMRKRISEQLSEHPNPAFRVTVQNKPTVSGKTETPKQIKTLTEKGRSMLVALSTPIQITCATGIALTIGQIVSSSRWYWAVLAAFIIFNNTHSRADTAIKAMHRIIGTFVGILVGILFATLLQGQVPISLAGIVLSLFVASYFMQVSYAVTVSFLTIALALIYGLLGEFTPDLLVLRLEETLIGALAGLFAAFCIFPKRASGELSSALEAYLSSLDTLLSAVHRSLDNKVYDADLLAYSNDVEHKLASVTDAARPVSGAWNVLTRYGVVREKLLFLTGCTHWARFLAANVAHGATLDPKDREQFEAIAAEITEQIRQMKGMKHNLFFRTSFVDLSRLRALSRTTGPGEQEENPLLAAQTISTFLGAFSRRDT